MEDLHKTVNKPNNKPAKKQNSQPDSITEVDFRLDEPRKTCSFKGNKKLWKAFVSEIKAQGLSVCHVLEPYCLAYLTAKVYLSRTIKPLRIENLVVERAVKRVRRYAEEIEEIHYCMVVDCNYRARVHLLDKLGKDWFFCNKHAGIPLKQGFVRVSDE